MKWYMMLLGVCATMAFGGVAHADLLTDGSFQSATQGSYFSGTITNSAWVVTIPNGSNVNGVEIIQTGGSSYPADPLTSGDPQAGGNQVAYFVGDNEEDVLTQTISGLSIGTSYQVGFDIETPYNGRLNPGIATFSASVGGVTLLSTTTNMLPSPANGTDNTAWVHESGNFIATSTSATFNFTFSTLNNGGGAGQDVLIDRVYVDTTASISSTPEPASLTMLGLGSVGLMGYGWRRKRQTAPVSA